MYWKLNNNKFHRGISFIEVLLVVALISILVSILASVSIDSFWRSQSRATESVVQEALIIARSNTESLVEDSEWGIKIQTGSVVVFSGSSFATRDTDNDVTLDIDNSVSGDDEFVFDSDTHRLSSTGTIDIDPVSGGSAQSFDINEFGNVEPS